MVKWKKIPELTLMYMGQKRFFLPDCPEYIIRNSYQGDVRENRKEREPRRMIRIQKPGLKKCRLYVDFLTKDHIHHNERFLLLTNLLWIEGGRRLFFAEISKKNYDRKKWRFYAKYIKEHGYRPQSCQGNCIYCEECHHKENMVLTVSERSRIRRIGPELFYEPAEDVYRYIGSCLEGSGRGRTIWNLYNTGPDCDRKNRELL